MKVGQKQRGFTIVEVMLVLGISSALLGALIFGTYRMIFDARFTDTITSASSFLQTQYEEARSGVRPSCVTDATKGRSNDLLLGKLVVFVNDQPGPVGGEDVLSSAPDTIDSYDILASNDAVNTAIDVSVELTNETRLSPEITKYLGSMKLATCGSAPIKTRMQLEWNSKFVEIFNYANVDGAPITDLNGDGKQDNVPSDTDFNALLIVRNPNGSDLHTYALVLSSTNSIGDEVIDEVVDALTKPKLPDAPETVYVDKRAALLIENGDSRNFRTMGAVCIDPGAGSTAVHGVRGIDASFNAGTSTFVGLTIPQKYEILQGQNGEGKCAK